MRDALRDADKTKDELLGELAILRQRVAELDTGGYHADRHRLREQQRVLMNLASRPELREADLDAALHEITAAAAECLSVERSSIWLYDQNRSLIRCIDLFERAENRHSSGLELSAKDCPVYFAALETERVVAAHDAHRDARTREFSASYLTPLQIGSMLDAPIRLGGRMLGVVCHEHVGPARMWSEEEQSFAGSIGDLVALAIASDQRRQLEFKVQHAQKLESLGILAGGIAHDFNNLLVGILGNAGLALDESPHGSRVNEYVDDIRTSAKRAADLCHQLLAYSGKGKFVIGPMDLNDLVREMVQLLEMSISKRTPLECELAPNLPLIEADATQLRQIVMNLITNASESMDDNGGVVSIRTSAVECRRDYLDHCNLGDHLPETTYVVLDVNDTGCGMDQETQQRIFDPFFSSKFAGRGLGLAAVQGIVRGHRGAIRIDSKPGLGTRFRILLPTTEDAPDAAEPDLDLLDAWRGHGTVLLVDDEASVRKVGRRMLERVGFQVIAANDGIEALEQYRQHAQQVVAVVLDLTMPRMSGEETFAELRRLRDDLPIVLTSGFSEQETMRRFEGESSTCFISKPFATAQLVGGVRLALG